MKKIAILASGSGSNAENIADYFKTNNDVEISLILTNNPNAFVIERAKRLMVPSRVFTKQEFKESAVIVDELKREGIDLVVLAGFLWLIPSSLIQAFPNRIVNIHPALLPKFGGKGMYGDKVHEAVKEAGETETGISIHYVNEKYDEGKIIYQAKTPVVAEDTADEIAAKVHALEYKHFPEVIASIL